MSPEPSVSPTALKSAVDQIVLAQVGVAVQFFGNRTATDVVTG